MRLLPAQNLVFPDDVLVGAERDIRPSEVLASLTGHIRFTDTSKSVIELVPIRFVSTLYRTTTGRDFTVPRWDPFHIGGDWQEIVPPMVVRFHTTVRNATRRVNGRGDLARMDRVVEDRGTYEDWAHPV